MFMSLFCECIPILETPAVRAAKQSRRVRLYMLRPPAQRKQES